MLRRTSFAFVSFLLAGFGSALFAQQASLSLASTPKTLIVANATAKGDVVIVGVAIRSENGVRVLRRFAEVVRDDDGDGRIEFTPAGEVPRRSVWAAVDLDSGTFAITAGAEYDSYLLPLPETVLKKDSAGLIEGIEHATIELDLLVVRPKSGAWRRHAAEMWENDEDGAVNGRISTRFQGATPIIVSYGEPPAKLKKDDVVVVIDIRRLRIGVTKVTQ